MGSWLNPDGLYLKFGTSGTTGTPNEGVSLQNIGQHQSVFSGEHYLEIPLVLSSLTETESIQSDVAILPDNSLITAVEVVTVTAAATGTAIDVGLIHISRNASDSEFTADPNGLLAAFVTGSMDTPGQTVRFFASGTANSEESLPASVTTGGDMVGDITTAPCLITASRTDATAFTAGRVLIRVYYVQNPTGGFIS